MRSGPDRFSTHFCRTSVGNSDGTYTWNYARERRFTVGAAGVSREQQSLCGGYASWSAPADRCHAAWVNSRR